MARKRRASRLRSSGKVEERDLLEAARLHADEPDLVQVACVGRHFLCPVQRLSGALAKIHARKDDVAFLERRSKRGRGLAKGYAGTLLLARAENAPYVGQLKLPVGIFPYAVRGTAAPTHYLALQHWEDPRLRLLAFAEFTKKKRYRFFSVGDGVVCAHRSGPVPSEYVDAQAERLGLSRAGDLVACPHPQALPALVLAWPKAGVTMRRCTTCLSAANTALEILQEAALPDAAHEFDADVAFPPVAGAPALDVSDAAAAAEYAKGTLTDAQFVERYAAARRRALEATPAPFFVLGDRAFREPAPFLDLLAPPPAERRALEAALAAAPRAVVLDRPSASRALEAVWAERGRAALEAAAGSADGAALYEPAAGADRIAELLRKAEAVGASRRAEEGLPKYARLPGPARVADAAARAYRRGGRDAALKALPDGQPGAERAIALAVRRVLDAHGAHAWKYTAEETGLAETLAPLAKRLLDAAPAEYHAALADLARAAGVTQELA